MNFTDRVKIAWAAFRGTGGVNLPLNGRSSEETFTGMLSAYLAAFSTISPVIDPQMLATLKYFWLYNPDFSQYVANIVNLGNPGHQLSVEAATDAAAESAVNRLNESAARLYDGGVDGLIDQYLTSLAWSGAISSEDVVNGAAKRVEKVVLVPVEQIVFKYNKDLDRYEPHQRSANALRNGSLGLIPLNSETYKYCALQTVENSPYAKPPATAAVEAILAGQVPIMENLRYAAQKYGLLGFIDYSTVGPRRKGGEDEEQYQARMQSHLTAISKALEGNLSKGLLVHPRDQKVDHKPVATGAVGFEEINKVSEQQVFSGLGAQPGFHGRTDSTTETFADVVYFLLTAQTGKLQRVAKRRHEQTCMLDLRLGGIDVDRVSMAFNKAHSRNAKEEAETEEIRQRVVFAKVEKGLISPDDAARELGYEAWEDETLLGGDSLGSLGRMRNAEFGIRNSYRRTINLSFDKRSQRYVFNREVLEVREALTDVRATDTAATGSGGNLVPFSNGVKKKALRASN